MHDPVIEMGTKTYNGLSFSWKRFLGHCEVVCGDSTFGKLVANKQHKKTRPCPCHGFPSFLDEIANHMDGSYELRYNHVFV